MLVLPEGNELGKARVKPPMTGNGKHTTYRNGDDWEMLYGIVLLTLHNFDRGWPAILGS